MPLLTFLPAGIFLLGLVLRFTQLDAHGLWYDEVTSVQSAQDGIAAIFGHRFGWIGNQPPWHYLLLWPFVQLADPANTAALVRIPSAVAGALTVLVVYSLGRELFGRAVGLLASALVALSPLLLDYSLDARPYGILVFLSVLSVYCLVKAIRLRSWSWWLGFTAVTVANLLNSYIALVLFVPPTALVLLAVLLRHLRREHGTKLATLLPIVVSSSVIGVVALATWLDFARVPRPSSLPNPTDASMVGRLFSTGLAILTSLTRFGLPDGVEPAVELLLLLFAIWGTFVAWRFGRSSGAILCMLFVLIPTVGLAVLSIGTTVYQRYIVFVAPFYFMLIAYALTNPTRFFRPREGSTPDQGVAANHAPHALLSVILTVVCLVCFAAGTASFVNPATHGSISYRPDFRGVASYLSEKAHQTDLVIFADDPALGYAVTDFYWHAKAPARVFDARDPRLFSAVVAGDIYWVVSSLNPRIVPVLSSGGMRRSAVARFEGVVVLKEGSGADSIAGHVDRMVGVLEEIGPNYQPFVAMGGAVRQARGDIASAVASYRAAGTYFPLSAEYLGTAEGFESLGDTHRAWREAIIARSMEPQLPEPHAWLARGLAQEGYLTESRNEELVARALQAP